ncbi:MAG: filamentous hemagglutinin N-terminal domain-containing protein [Cyanobacteria bacterium P01_H01_bin.21]
MAKRYILRLWVVSKLFACSLLSCQAAWAQVIPDGTTATPDPGSCAVNCTITGGTIDSTGTNLFHSFSEFSVPEGSIVTFDHDPALMNILARVANGPLSMIEGTIRTDITSNTNLFLMNPQGIIFGPRGSLELGGSFVATTADAIQFGDQGSFSTTDTTSDLVRLTVDPSALLFSQSAPRPIINQSGAFNLTSFTIGLSVQEGNSLLLVGGDVIIERAPTSFRTGSITARGSRVELGGVDGAATVGLDIDGGSIRLSYPDNVSLADVTLDSAVVNISNDLTSADRSISSLVIRANSIAFTKSSIDSTTSGPDNAGNILLYANESINLDDSGIGVTTNGSGNGGSLIVLTDTLSLENGATFSVRTNRAGNAGEISLTADSILLSNSSRIIAEADGRATDPAGSAGKIEIQTGTLSLVDESSISTQTFDEAIDTEAAGLININAQEFVSLANDGSSITSATSGQQNAGDIIINTPELTIQDLASISAFSNVSRNITTEGDAGSIVINGANQVTLSNGSITTETNTLGSGGNITLNTDQLTADSGARLTATATATADASTQGGSVTLNTNQINISGETTGILAETQGPADAGLITLGPNGNSETLIVNFQDGANISAATSSSGAGGQVLVDAETVTLSGDGSLSTRSTGSGPAGNVFIQTSGQFRVQEGARVEVSGESTGDSGMLDVIAETVVLDNGQLLASVEAGEGGNIELELEDALVLRGDSLISAEAFKDADGGNVDITAPFIIALFAEGPDGNDIEASAVDGDGGRITIQANTLFNIEENRADGGNMTNDIDASSEAGIDGEVVIQTLEVDPNEGTDPLPSGLAEPEISQGCQVGVSNSGQFTNAGRGGLPINPYAPLSSEGIQEDIYPAGQIAAQSENNSQLANSNDTAETIAEAIGWDRNNQGDVVLLAATPSFYNSCQHTLTGES